MSKRKQQADGAPALIVTLSVVVGRVKGDKAGAYVSLFADGEDDLVEMIRAESGGALVPGVEAFQAAVLAAIGGVRNPDTSKRLMPVTLSQSSKVGRA